MKEGYILFLFVLGIFLVFTVSGQITGNPILGSSKAEKAINAGILDMLNKCAVLGSNNINKNCNTICNEKGKKCTGAFTFVDNPDKQIGDKEMVITLPLGCSESPEYVSYIKDRNGNLARLDSDLVACTCCSP